MLRNIESSLRGTTKFPSTKLKSISLTEWAAFSRVKNCSVTETPFHRGENYRAILVESFTSHCLANSTITRPGIAGSRMEIVSTVITRRWDNTPLYTRYLLGNSCFVGRSRAFAKNLGQKVSRVGNWGSGAAAWDPGRKGPTTSRES